MMSPCSFDLSNPSIEMQAIASFEPATPHTRTFSPKRPVT